MMDLSQEFLNRSRAYFIDDYLQKIERCLMLLTDDQIWWRPNEQSNSIGNLVLHLSGNVRQYVVSGAGGAEDIRQREKEFDARSVSRDTLLTMLRTTLQEVDQVLGRLKAADLQDACILQGRRMTKFEAIYHAVEHFSMHTGQIIYVTKLLTEQNLGFYAFKNGNVERRW